MDKQLTYFLIGFFFCLIGAMSAAVEASRRARGAPPADEVPGASLAAAVVGVLAFGLTPLGQLDGFLFLLGGICYAAAFHLRRRPHSTAGEEEKGG